MGIFSFKNGSYYIGDFYRNDISGYGMQIVPNADLKECKNCFVYIGNWKENKKSGYGRCYNRDGFLIYQGNFSDDKPTSEYPSDDVEQRRHFAICCNKGKESYIGEFLDNKINGFGFLVFENGDSWIGNFKDGKQKGIGLYMQADGEWETLNYEDESCYVVSSSENYKALDAERKDIVRSAVGGAMKEFSMALEKSNSLIASKIPVKENRSAKDSDNTYESASSKTITSSESSSSNTPSKHSQTGKTSSKKSSTDAFYHKKESDVYSNYETQLIKMNTYWERDYDDNLRKSIQRNMKQIRTKWESRGYRMFHSQWEDWNGQKI